MNGIDYGTISEVLVILSALFVLSYFYNREIEKAGSKLEGWDWLLVMIGTFYTQVAIGLLDLILPSWNAFYLGMLAYAVSGFPMMYGAYCRHQETQERARKALNE